MIELEDSHIVIAAVHARMLSQVGQQPSPDNVGYLAPAGSGLRHVARTVLAFGSSSHIPLPCENVAGAALRTTPTTLAEVARFELAMGDKPKPH